jgi:hypothetical protein
VYDRSTATLAQFGQSTTFDISMWERLLVGMATQFIYSADQFEIWSIDMKGKKKLRRRSASRIMTMAASQPFCSLVFATFDRKVHFASLVKGCDIITIQLSEAISEILIPPK